MTPWGQTSGLPDSRRQIACHVLADFGLARLDRPEVCSHSASHPPPQRVPHKVG